jgi:hypothetical protein
MSGPESIAFMTMCVAAGSTLFGIVYLRHKESMALIDRGVNPRNAESRPKPFFSLKYGLLLCGSGLGLICAYLLNLQYREKVLTSDGDFYYRDNPEIYFALLAIGGGLGLVLSYFIEKKHWMDKRVNS